MMGGFAMRLFYRAKQGTEVTFEQTGPVTFCCLRMCELWNVLVGFGAPGCRASSCREVCVWQAVPQTNGKPICNLVPISHCPFCGQAVEPIRVKSSCKST